MPDCGLFCGAITTKLASPAAARALIASIRLRPPWVSFATTRTLAMRFTSLRGRCRRDAAGRRRLGLRRRLEDAVDRAGYAVLVRTAHHRRHRVEVEDRGRRGDLPLQRQRAPRVGGGARAEAPAHDHVVEEDERAEAEQEARDRDR